MAYIQSHVPVQYIQPDTAGFCDPEQQQLCVPQQMAAETTRDVCLQSHAAGTISKQSYV